MENEKNEFDDLSVDEEVPEQEFSQTPQDELISSGSAGVIYDYNKAPEGVKAPPRVDLDGKVIVLKKADIVLPPTDRPWDKTKAGDKDCKFCTFILYYDYEGQQEFYSGVRVFKREDGRYSHPTITRDRKSQSSQLLGLYADYKKKDINEVSLKEFMSFLNSKPRVKIKSADVRNPTNDEIVRKNFVGEFVSG